MGGWTGVVGWYEDGCGLHKDKSALSSSLLRDSLLQ